MPDKLQVQVWTWSLPSREHLDHNEDAFWSARNGIAHAVIDGMGGGRRIVNGREIGGEHAAAGLVAVLDRRLQGLPSDLQIADARRLLAAVVDEAGAEIYRDVNQSGQIPADQIPAGKTAEEISAGAVMTAVIFCEGGRRAFISQNGDTRAFLFSDGALMLLTDDQDALMLDTLNGAVTQEEAAAIQDEMDSFDGHAISQLSAKARTYFLRRNLLFGQIGDSPTPRSPDFVTIQLRSGDMLALLSDGVYANLTQAQIAELLRSSDPATAMVVRADAFSTTRSMPNPDDPTEPYNYRAHKDDATAVVVRVAW